MKNNKKRITEVIFGNWFLEVATSRLFGLIYHSMVKGIIEAPVGESSMILSAKT